MKKKMKVKLADNNFRGLRELKRKMESAQQNLFRRKYGNLLDLLEVEVPMPAITALHSRFSSLCPL